METRYRILGPDEVIQEGDERELPFNQWVKVEHSIGKTPRQKLWVYRRPIPPVDPLVAELVEALEELIELVWVGGHHDPKAADKAIKLVSKARATLKTYETVDGKENKP